MSTSGGLMEYDRRVPAALLQALSLGGPLHGFTRLSDGDVDLQLRAHQGNGTAHATLYVGLTRAGDLCLDRFGRVKLKPQDAVPAAVALWQERWGHWQPVEMLARDWPAIERYLRAGIAGAHRRYRASEGALQPALNRLRGVALLDREAMIAFPSQSLKQAVVAELRAPLQAAVDSLRPAERWARRRAPFGDKLDAIGLDSTGRVLVMEAKSGENLGACGWAPTQVAMYLALFNRWVERDPAHAGDILRGLRDQRHALGLLEPSAAGFALREPLALAPVIALSEPLLNAREVNRRMRLVLNALRTHGVLLPGLELWLLRDGEAERVEPGELPEPSTPHRRQRVAAGTGDTATRARWALAQPLIARGVALDADNRTASLDDNLAAPLSPAVEARVRAAFAAGAGGELTAANGRRPKLHSAHSSAALTLSAFAPFAERPGLLAVVGVEGIESVQFEGQLPTGVRGTPPHLDLIAHHAGGRLAVESKCTEYLSPKPALFSGAYRRVAAGMHPSWRMVYERLLEDPRAFHPLDAAQLVKHYWGLSHTRVEGADILLYVYWEPADATENPVFGQHHDAVDAFARRVDDPDCRFTAISYPELWTLWSREPELSGHAAALRARYEVRLDAR